MDYAISQSLVNDLLGDGANFAAEGPAFYHDDAQEQHADLHRPGLWSDSESEASAHEKDLDSEIPGFDNTLAQLKEDVRGAVRFRRRKGKKAGRQGHPHETFPSFEVQTLLGQANQAFVTNHLDQAKEILETIIAQDCNIFAAWQTLGEVQKEMGNLDNCRTAWMTAAHLRPRDADMWAAIAELNVQCGCVDDAEYCYKKLSRLRPEDVDILWDRAMLNKDNARPNGAIAVFRQILKLIPFEMTIVRELVHLYHEQGLMHEAIALYKTTADHYMDGDNRETFGWSELNIMAELCIATYSVEGRSELWKELISRIKTVARWLRGRQSEVWWADRDDDAEWDSDDQRRKLEPRFSVSDDPHAFTLPCDIKTKLGKARLAISDHQEALRHFEFLEDTSEEEMPDLFLDTADALLKAKLWEEALHLYSRLINLDQWNGPQLLSSMAKAFKESGDYVQAEDCLDHVLEHEPDNTDAMLLLAEVYELVDHREKALELINRVIELRRHEESVNTEMSTHTEVNNQEVPSTAFFKTDKVTAARVSGRKRSTKKPQAKEDLVAYENRKTEETRTQFKAIELTTPQMLAGDLERTEQWMSAASDLFDDFRSIRHFYPAQKRYVFQGVIRHGPGHRAREMSQTERLKGIAQRLEESITADEALETTITGLEEFRGFHFSEWLNVFLQYTILLVESDQTTEAFAVLEGLLTANVFYQNQSFFHRIHLARMVLATKARAPKIAAEEARWIILNNLVRDDGYKLYTAALSSGLASIDLFKENNNQKFMLRQVKTMDSVLIKKNTVDVVGDKESYGNAEAEDITEALPTLLFLYGHMLSASRGYVASLQYFTKAYACAPDEPLILFSIGLAYLHRSMQRQSDNRHLQIMQAFSFLFRYRRQRRSSEDPSHLQEVEYNFGRALHQLGLFHLALRHYEQALAITGIDPTQDLSYSAAYNMQLIYILAGNSKKAREISMRHLVI